MWAAGTSRQIAELEVFYFYNSKEIPSRTEQLFHRSNNPVRPLELDIGPQSIAGSTRLQGASLAELALGALLGTAILGEKNYGSELVEKMRQGNRMIGNKIEQIADFVKKEAAVFCSPNANFRRLQDETKQGYVTFLGEKNTLREILIDATETSPTFSTNPIRRENETNQKRAEFRAYLIGERENREAWKALLGRDIRAEDLTDADQFLLAVDAKGKHSYGNRPTGPGNFVIGVAKVARPAEIGKELTRRIESALAEGGEGGLIVLSRAKGSLPSAWKSRTLLLEEVPSDSLGLVETVLLKQILNLISNGSMILMNKVHGNRMIDVRASNQKLIDRSSRLIQEIWKDSGRSMLLSDRELYHWIAHVSALKKNYAEAGTYTPSVVKIVLAMLHLGKKPSSEEFQEVVRFLADRKEALDFLEPSYTLCIDGGGSKTLLQIVDAKGQIVKLYRQGKALDGIEAGASNINVVKKEGVKTALSDLLSDVWVGPERKALSEILPYSRVVAGMAGVSIAENHNAVTSLFEEFGIGKERLLLMIDAEMALRLLKGNGVVLIAGTGSICFAEKDGVRQRVGGLGRILGDEGSGYQIGLSALRASLAEEYGYGPPTALTSVLKDYFKVAELKSLFPKINSLVMSAAEIAAIAPLVFEQAAAKDAVAAGIVSRAADDLRQLVATALKITGLRNSELHLWGGVFKGRYAEPILEKIRKETDPRGIKIVNQSSENAAVLFARTFQSASLQ